MHCWLLGQEEGLRDSGSESEMEDLHIPAPLAVKVFPSEGRGLVAREELAKGQAVIRSKAFASVVAAEVIDRFCAFCTRPTK